MIGARSFDEVNDLVANKRGIDFEEYFSTMDISNGEKEKRVELAKRLNDQFLVIVSLLFMAQQRSDPQQHDRPDERRDQAAQRPDGDQPEQAQQPSAEHPADNTDHDIEQQARTAALDDQTGDVTHDEPDQ